MAGLGDVWGYIYTLPIYANLSRDWSRNRCNADKMMNNPEFMAPFGKPTAGNYGKSLAIYSTENEGMSTEK